MVKSIRAADKEKVVATVAGRAEVEEARAVEYVDRAEEIFLAETGRVQVPERAMWLWIDLALAIFKDESGGTDKNVSSIKRGDTTIQFRDADAGFQTSATLMERIHFWRVVKAR